MGIENEYTIQIGWREAEIATWSPAVEVFEREGNLVVRAELPALSQDAVKAEATAEGLVTSGERKQEHEDKGEGFYRSERSYGQFYRLVPLPEDVTTSQVRADFNKGALEITVRSATKLTILLFVLDNGE